VQKVINESTFARIKFAAGSSWISFMAIDKNLPKGWSAVLE
jgi:hypothetical protein